MHELNLEIVLNFEKKNGVNLTLQFQCYKLCSAMENEHVVIL